MEIEVKAVTRDVQGTGASRRLRRAGKVPGVIYGANKDAVSLEFDHKDLFMQFRHEAFHASILSLSVDGKKEKVLLRDYQLHPVRNTIQHIDFQRVNENEKIHVKVPLHFINADIAPGVKIGGGVVAHIFTEVDVACLPKDLPGFLEVDVAELELGQSIHLTEIELPKGVEFTELAHGNDLAVASIAKTRGSKADDEPVAAPEAEAEAEDDKTEE